MLVALHPFLQTLKMAQEKLVQDGDGPKSALSPEGNYTFRNDEDHTQSDDKRQRIKPNSTVPSGASCGVEIGQKLDSAPVSAIDKQSAPTAVDPTKGTQHVKKKDTKNSSDNDNSMAKFQAIRDTTSQTSYVSSTIIEDRGRTRPARKTGKAKSRHGSKSPLALPTVQVEIRADDSSLDECGSSEGFRTDLGRVPSFRYGHGESTIGGNFISRVDSAVHLHRRKVSWDVELSRNDSLPIRRLHSHRGRSFRTVSTFSVIEPHNEEEMLVVMAEGNASEEEEYEGEINKFLANLYKSMQQQVIEAHWYIQGVAILGCALLTYSLSNQDSSSLHLQLATMVVIVLSGATHPQLITPSACGAFAGGQLQSSTIPSYLWLLVLSFVVFLTWMFVSYKKIWVGYSGRLGTTVFVAMNITMLFGLGPSSAVPWGQYGDLENLWVSNLHVEACFLYIASVVVLSVVAGWTRLNAATPVNPVLIPCAIALLFMLIVRSTGAEEKYEHTTSIYNGVAVGAYVAMASDARIPTARSFGLAGVFASLWGLLLIPFFRGFGGKGGFIAFLGCCTYEWFSLCWTRVNDLIVAPWSHDPKKQSPHNEDMT